MPKPRKPAHPFRHFHSLSEAIVGLCASRDRFSQYRPFRVDGKSGTG